MFQNILYEFHTLQFYLLKKEFPRNTTVNFETTPKIHLDGLEILPKKPINSPVGILFHGYTSHYRNLSYVARLLLSKGVAVLMINLRGHGKSAGNKNDALGMQQDLKYIIDYVDNQEYFNKERILLLGSSLGAMLTLTAGYKHPKITHLIALAGMSSPSKVLNGMSKFRRWRWKQIARFGGLNLFDMTGNSAFNTKTQPLDGNNDKLVLLLHCSNDRLISIDNFQENVKNFSLSPTDHLIIQKGSHNFFLVKNQVLSKIDEWLKTTYFYNAE